MKIKFLQHLVEFQNNTKTFIDFSRFLRALLIRWIFLLLFTIVVYLMNHLINHNHYQKCQHRP